MSKKTILILILILITFIGFSIFSFIPNNLDIPDVKTSDFELNEEASLGYGGYAYFYAEADEEDKFEWEFDGSNNYVGITVYAMTDAEFSKFQNLLTFYAYTLSNGSYFRDSGTFKPRSHDTWYVVFLNRDSDLQITYLTYDVDIVRGNNWLETFLGPLIAIIIIGSIIGGGVEMSRKSKKKKEGKIITDDRIDSKEGQKTEAQTLTTTVYDLKYCTRCGVPQEKLAKFCEKCGTAFLAN